MHEATVLNKQTPGCLGPSGVSSSYGQHLKPTWLLDVSALLPQLNQVHQKVHLLFAAPGPTKTQLTKRVSNRETKPFQ